MYLCSAEYNPEREHTICATDPALEIDWPSGDGIALRMSDRDAAAPSLEQVQAFGLLPTWDATRVFIDGLRQRPQSDYATSGSAGGGLGIGTRLRWRSSDLGGYQTVRTDWPPRSL